MSGPFAPDVLVEQRDAICVITLNRPETLNAVSPEIHTALTRVWRHAATESGARAIVLTGTGKAFSAGGDMEMLKSLQTDPAERRRQLDEAAAVVREQLACPLPIVVAVNGPAVGLGCSITVLADLVVMADDAYLSDPHAAIGLTAGDGGAATWPLLVGMLRAKEHLLLGSQISAQEAREIGLANRVVPTDDVLGEATQLAERLAALPPQAVQSTKRALNLHIERAISGILEYALAAEYHSFDTPEHQAVVEGFLERRH